MSLGRISTVVWSRKSDSSLPAPWKPSRLVSFLFWQTLMETYVLMSMLQKNGGETEAEMQGKSCLLFKKKPRDCFWVTFIQQPVTLLILESPIEKGSTISPVLFPPIAGLILLHAGKHWLELGYHKICQLPVMTSVQLAPPSVSAPLLCRARTACSYILTVMLTCV